MPSMKNWWTFGEYHACFFFGYIRQLKSFGCHLDWSSSPISMLVSSKLLLAFARIFVSFFWWECWLLRIDLVIMMQNGFMPWDLLQKRDEWAKIDCDTYEDSFGQEWVCWWGFTFFLFQMSLFFVFRLISHDRNCSNHVTQASSWRW